jgi:hypothetical protein
VLQSTPVGDGPIAREESRAQRRGQVLGVGSGSGFGENSREGECECDRAASEERDGGRGKEDE